MGFNNMWILLNDVLPRAIQKHGGFSPEALAKAARETDIPEGGTMQGYGVKFLGEGNPMRGQNERAVRRGLPGGRRPVRGTSGPRSSPRRNAARPPARLLAALGGPLSLIPARRREARPSGRAGTAPVLTVSGLTKRFGGFTALQRASPSR